LFEIAEAPPFGATDASCPSTIGATPSPAAASSPVPDTTTGEGAPGDSDGDGDGNGDGDGEDDEGAGATGDPAGVALPSSTDNGLTPGLSSPVIMTSSSSLKQSPKTRPKLAGEGKRYQMRLLLLLKGGVMPSDDMSRARLRRCEQGLVRGTGRASSTTGKKWHFYW